MEKTTYLDTREEFSKEDYKEYCEGNDIDFAETDDNDFWNWVNDTRSMYAEDFWGNLGERAYASCVITGTLGLWNGTHDIHPVFCSLGEAITKCTNDMYDYDIKGEEDGLHINGYHHDGTNRFLVRFLSGRGEEVVANGEDFDFEDKANFDDTIDYLF